MGEESGYPGYCRFGRAVSGGRRPDRKRRLPDREPRFSVTPYGREQPGASVAAHPDAIWMQADGGDPGAGGSAGVGRAIVPLAPRVPGAGGGYDWRGRYLSRRVYLWPAEGVAAGAAA